MQIQDKKEINPKDGNDHIGQVALPFNEDQFKDFIVSLLGKPQTITKRFRGTFEITKDDIISLFEILNQRIYQQNESKLIQFRATIYYDDNSTVTLNGFDHLVHFNETLPIVSKAIHLTWQYLIKFRDKSTFEKQEVNVSFVTEMDGRMSIDDEPEIYNQDNQVNIRIQHTARTWGADIEGILSRHIKTQVKKNSKIFEFFQYNTEKVQNGIAGILAIITLGFSLFYTYKKNLNTHLDGNPIYWIHHYGSLIFLITGVFILLKITLIILEKFEIYTRPSFILLTSQSIKQKEITLKSFKAQWSKYLWTIIFSIVLGVVGNYIYGYLTQ